MVKICCQIRLRARLQSWKLICRLFKKPTPSTMLIFAQDKIELAMLCVNRWVSLDRICWLVDSFNSSESEAFFVYLNNALNENPITLSSFLKNQARPSKFCFCINVGKDKRGNTFFGSHNSPVSHWSLCHVDTTKKNITYGDSLGWTAPADLLSTLDKYVKTTNIEDTIEKHTVVILHDPNSKCPTTGGHKCTENCSHHYPLHTCSGLCGVVVMVVAAIACHNSDLFASLTNVEQPASTDVPPIFLTNPTSYSKYLWLALSSWIASNEVNIFYIVPQFWK